MTNPIRIAILEDDDAYIEVLKTVFRASSEARVTEAFTNPVTFLTELPQLAADVILLDIYLPKISGLECLKSIREFRPDCRAIMLTVNDDTDSILQAVLDGAVGYLLKDASRREITAAVMDAMDGGAPMSSVIAKKVVGLLGRLEPTQDADAGGNHAKTILSTREYEVLEILAAGRKYAEIGKRLHISLPTVKTHISHIYEKLHVRNKIEAISLLKE
jgi:DNA-binding NarL/FixJ family response regulator